MKSNGSYIVSKMRNSTIKGWLNTGLSNLGLSATSYLWRERTPIFSGVTGTVYINDNGDRIADYALLDMDTADGRFKVANSVP